MEAGADILGNAWRLLKLGNRKLMLADKGIVMRQEIGRCTPGNEQIRVLFRQLTERGMGQLNFHDPDTIQYITNLLTEFVHVRDVDRIQNQSSNQDENPLNMLVRAGRTISRSMRRDRYKQLGDLTLFNLGLFPEHLTYGRRIVSLSSYAYAGRRSYAIVAEMDFSPSGTTLYRKLSERFDQCVAGLNWVKLYINDPFYQYMFREFKIAQD
jgi:hypothetical protein